MRFLLNEKLEFFSVVLKEQENGDLERERIPLGYFFASVKLLKEKQGSKLCVILRTNPSLEGDLEVIFKGDNFEMSSKREVVEGFFKIIFEKRRY